MARINFAEGEGIQACHQDGKKKLEAVSSLNQRPAEAQQDGG
ncbi:MAG: hypothetical protein ACYDDO_15545 [Acidiferrobacterales bacterium]